MATKVETPVAPTRVRLYCECGVEMICTGTLMCAPPLYEHYCPSCHEISRQNTRYPTIRYDECAALCGNGGE